MWNLDSFGTYSCPQEDRREPCPQRERHKKVPHKRSSRHSKSRDRTHKFRWHTSGNRLLTAG